jgi:hypothetical protein
MLKITSGGYRTEEKKPNEELMMSGNTVKSSVLNVSRQNTNEEEKKIDLHSLNKNKHAMISPIFMSKA